MLKFLTAMRCRAAAIVVGACLLGLTQHIEAKVLPITATFNPDPNNPQKNEFRNTTPNMGFCRDYPVICQFYGIYSQRSHVTSELFGPIEANHPDVRKGAMFKAPANWRRLTVKERTTGEEATVEVRIAGVGGTYRLSHNVTSITGAAHSGLGHIALWKGGNWARPPGPCIGIGNNTVSSFGFQFFWLTPNEGICSKEANFPIPGFGMQYLDFTYQLRTPDPLKMSTGVYEGTQVYTVGPGGDFDLGDIVLLADNIIQLDFTLTVEHALKVEIPPGGNRIELVPQGGWQAWLQQGRKPTRLFRDQTFNIWASSRFKMKLECEHSKDSKNCALREAGSGDLVPLNLSVTLPRGLSDASGQAVERRPLLLDGSGTELFQPAFYLTRRPGTLHFEIPPDQVAQMLRPAEQRQYSGNVTVIWDSQI
ncbi:hypothetical protein [Pseudomonas sp. LB3P31]